MFRSPHPTLQPLWAPAAYGILFPIVCPSGHGPLCWEPGAGQRKDSRCRPGEELSWDGEVKRRNPHSSYAAEDSEIEGEGSS